MDLIAALTDNPALLDLARAAAVRLNRSKVNKDGFRTADARTIADELRYRHDAEEIGTGDFRNQDDEIIRYVMR